MHKEFLRRTLGASVGRVARNAVSKVRYENHQR